MNEPYSRKLSAEARSDLIDFIEAYLFSLSSTIADQRAERAKQQAIKLLRDTDIDILVFVTMIATMHSETGVQLMMLAVGGHESARDIAVALVKIMEEGLRRDKQVRGRMG